MSDLITDGMEYNSAREDLIIPEYGRNVQKLINHAKTIEDPAFRQKFVEAVVDLMQQMHPQSRNIDDYRDRLWKHVFRIAKYELDVTPPSGQKPRPEDSRKRPEKVAYPVMEAKFRHYGHNVQQLIKKALSMPEGPKRDGFVAVIGSYMKLAYRTWNKEHYVSDDIIKGDLESLSNGQLSLDDNASIDHLSGSGRRRKRASSSRDRDRDNSGGRPGDKPRRNYRRKK
ncbi:MAG: DUF4290 domain-containing protein [Lewinellaceae bacterium]|nr:DUF4290 domain-containing protein [Lewinellaceae bacterium]